jgi:putative ABC transport system substrate-binding protein
VEKKVIIAADASLVLEARNDANLPSLHREGWMRRREFIAGLGGIAGSSLTAFAQQQRVWRIGYLTASSIADRRGVALFDAFRMQLQELGYVEGRNLNLNVRRAEGDFAKLPVLANELVSLAPDVVIGVTAAGTAALQRATSSLPIVMLTAGDPVESGFAKSLAKPGGNITGLYNQSRDVTAKSVELLHAIIPKAKRIAVLMSPQPIHQTMVTEAFAGAEVLGLTIVPVMARTPSDLDDAFTIMHKEKCDALIVLADARLTRKIVELADQWRLPTIYQYAEFADMGGLLSYGADLTPQFRRAAVYVDKILKGANPADLPVEQPTKMELEVNLKSAKSLGLTIPDSILARADKVIE